MKSQLTIWDVVERAQAEVASSIARELAAKAASKPGASHRITSPRAVTSDDAEIKRAPTGR
jgi:hypothetical protein